MNEGSLPPMAGGRWRRLSILLPIGAGALAVLFFQDPTRAWAAVLVDGFYLLGLGLGGAVFIASIYLCDAAWASGLRRVPEALMAVLPIAGVCLLGVYFGRGSLYLWSRPAELAEHPLAPAKAAYFEAPFFLLRMLCFLACWLLLARLLRRLSLAQDQGEALLHHRRLRRASAVFVPLFALTFSLASFDWLMSLDPRWYSTIFAIYTFAGIFVQAIAAVTLVLLALDRGGHGPSGFGAEQRHDLGKLLFAFSTFWAYIWLSQYLLIWYGDLPEETVYYLVRTREPWRGLFLLNLGLNWLLPFLLLLSRRAKRAPSVLALVSALLLLGHWLDLYLIVLPTVTAGWDWGTMLLELLVAVGFAAVAGILIRRALGGASLVPVNDPWLALRQTPPR